MAAACANANANGSAAANAANARYVDAANTNAGVANARYTTCRTCRNAATARE